MCQLLIYNFHLLSYTLFVYRLKYLFDEFSIHATQCALRAAFLEDFVVASGLQDGHVMLFFVSVDPDLYRSKRDPRFGADLLR